MRSIEQLLTTNPVWAEQTTRKTQLIQTSQLTMPAAPFLPSSPSYMLQPARQYSQNKEALASARDMGMNYLAMTDHAVLYGAIEFYRAAESVGIKPIIGCDVYVARNGIAERKTQRDNMSLVLLAEKSNRIQQPRKTRLPSAPRKACITNHVSTNQCSASARRASSDSPETSAVKSTKPAAMKTSNVPKSWHVEYADILGPNNFFLELMDHGEADEKIANRNLIFLAEKAGLPSLQPTMFTISNKNTPKHTTYHLSTTRQPRCRPKPLPLSRRSILPQKSC